MKMENRIKSIIDLDEVKDILERKSRINRINIMDAVFVQNNKEVKVSEAARDSFRFTGLNTIDFVSGWLLESDEYKQVN